MSENNTTDLVKRLREGRTDGTALRWAVTPIHIEAAAEIERLRAIEEKCVRTQIGA